MKKVIATETGKKITCSGREIGLPILLEIVGAKEFMKVSDIVTLMHTMDGRQVCLTGHFALAYEVACGTGGVGSLRIRRNGDVYMQYTCGHGRNNYADCAVIGRIKRDRIGEWHFYGAFS